MDNSSKASTQAVILYGKNECRRRDAAQTIEPEISGDLNDEIQECNPGCIY